MKGTEFAAGLLIGAVVGAALGMIYAPQSGAETRDVINTHARDLSDKVKESSRQLLESSRELLEQGKTQVANAVQNYVGKEGAGEA